MSKVVKINIAYVISVLSSWALLKITLACELVIFLKLSLLIAVKQSPIFNRPSLKIAPFSGMSLTIIHLSTTSKVKPKISKWFKIKMNHQENEQ